MNSKNTLVKADKPIVLFGAFSILFLSLFLQYDFNLKQALFFLLGVGFGVTLMHAMFGFSGGWRNFIRTRDSFGLRAQILLIIFSSILFFPIVGGLFSDISSHAALGQVGLSVLIGAFLFGIGMQLGGGCGSGTLFTVGQGQTDMFITLTFPIFGKLNHHGKW